MKPTGIRTFAAFAVLSMLVMPMNLLASSLQSEDIISDRIDILELDGSAIDRLIALAGGDLDLGVARELVSPLLEDHGERTLLEFADWAQVPHISGPVPAFKSHTLGATALPDALPLLYEARALESGAPLRTAILVWNEALKLRDPAEVLLDPEIYRADRLPHDAQVAIAVLVYALTDATMLQKQAVSNVSPQEYAYLLSAPGRLMTHGMDPFEQEGWEFLMELELMSQHVDMGLINAAAQIVTASVAHVLPDLEKWGQQERERAMNAPSPDRFDPLQSFLDEFGGERIRELDPIERLDALSGALRTMGHLHGLPVAGSVPPPVQPSHDRPLVHAIERLTGLFETEIPDLSIEGELVRADHLPEPLQIAMARVILNYVEWAEHLLAPPSGDASSLEMEVYHRRSLEAQIRMVNAVKESAPTLEAWGLVWARHGQALLPATPFDASASRSAYEEIGRRMADPATGVQEIIMLSAHVDGTTIALIDEPPLPPRGALVDTVLALYDRYGIDVDEDTRTQIQEGVSALPGPVEQNVARILIAQLSALDQLDGLYGSLDERDIELIMMGIDPFSVLKQPSVSLDQVRLLRDHYDLSGRVHDSYYGAALTMAAALDVSKRELVDWIEGDDEPVPEEKGRPWYRNLLNGMPRLIGTAAAQSVPGEGLIPDAACPGQSPLSDCSNDVWFIDPVFETVVVSGFGRTIYDPREMGAKIDLTEVTGIVNFDGGIWGPRGQMLSVDLGGDDVYMNNAGGAFMSTTNPEWFGTGLSGDPTMVAVALDLGGNDQYLPPPEDSAFSQDAIQGAGVGGIGILWDRSGNDQYFGGNRSQGFGGGYSGELREDVPCQPIIGNETTTAYIERCIGGLFGIGVLLDGDGHDEYQAKSYAQGASAPIHDLGGLSAEAPVRFQPDEPTNWPTVFGGMGLLIDRAGNDRYILTGNDAFGQGGGDQGIGMLVDAAGDDSYEGGDQGNGRNMGVGVLMDLEGDDTYSRPAEDGVTFGNGVCWTSLRAPQGNPFDRPLTGPFYEGLTDGSDPAQGVFIDLDDGACDMDASQFLPALEPDSLFDDEDRDGWPDWIEELIGTDTAPGPGGDDYPAGLPKDPPPGWMSDWPPSLLGGDLPHGSPFLVRIPGVLAVGDAVDTFYPPSPLEGFPGFDYAVTLDIGGDDLYTNRVGGASPLNPGLPQLAVDLGGDDDYVTESPRVHGANGFLIDLGGDDVFFSGPESQGTATRGSFIENPSIATVGPFAVGATGPGVGVLFNADGDDVYVIEDYGRGQGLAYLDPDLVDSGMVFGILLDASGDDAYHAGSQGTVAGEPVGSVNRVTGAFIDLDGEDEYVPVGHQGRWTGQTDLSLNVSVGFEAIALFVDAHGDDVYRGTVTDPTKPDWSHIYNDDIHFQYEYQPGFPMTGVLGLRVDDNGTHRSEDWSMGAVGDGSRLNLGVLGILIGTADDDYVPEDYALVVNPGGDNVYRNNAGGTLIRSLATEGTFGNPGGGEHRLKPSEAYPVASLLVDLEGDDRYEIPENWVSRFHPTLDANQDYNFVQAYEGGFIQGAGFLGVGMLVDMDGDDVYVARGLSQGVGFLGVGVLWDRRGDDHYTIDKNLVKNPAIDRDVVVWEEFSTNTVDRVGWQIKIQRPAADDLAECRVSHHSVHGARDPSVLRMDSFAHVTFSAFDPDTQAWRIARTQGDFRNCQHNQAFVNGMTWLSASPSNQYTPQITPTHIIWVDDRDGSHDIYWKQRTRPTQASDSLLVEAPADTNQERPSVHGNTLVWQDDRDGGWSIRTLNLNNQQEQKISPEDGRHHTNPQVADQFIVWQSQDLVSGGWDVMVFNRATGEIRHLDLPGDQINPDTAGGEIMYQDETSQSVVRYQWSTDSIATARVDASQPALDRSFNRAAWVYHGGIEPDAARPAGSLHSEIARGGATSTATGTPEVNFASIVHLRPNNELLQGASWVAGTGLIFDEGGFDLYEGGWWSQGAVLSSFDPKMDFSRDTEVNVGLRAERDTFGSVVSLAGNDVFHAQAFSQGAQVGATHKSVFLDPVYLEMTPVNLGLLFNLRGSDTYQSNWWSQGYGAFSIGFMPSYQPHVGVAPGAQQPGAIPDVRAYLVNHHGIILDTSGHDRYESIGHFFIGDELLVSLPEDSSDRNDAVTTQKGRGETENHRASTCRPGPSQSTGFWCEAFADFFFSERCTRTDNEVVRGFDDNDYNPCAKVFGGIGIDLPLFDTLDPVMTEVTNLVFDVDLTFYQVDDQGDPLVFDPQIVRARDTVLIEATIVLNDTSGQLRDRISFDMVEFFIDDQLQGYGEPVADAATTYAHVWKTDGGTWPDGVYNVRVRAHFGTEATTTIGFAEGSERVSVDNPPTITGLAVSEMFFSPNPFASDAPSLPNVTFLVPPDPWVNDAWAHVEIRGPLPDDSLVRTLWSFEDNPVEGKFDLEWDGLDSDGRVVPSGMYEIFVTVFDRFEVDDQTGRMDAAVVPIRVISDLDMNGCIQINTAGGPVTSCNQSATVNNRNSNPTGIMTTLSLLFTNPGENEIRRIHLFSGENSGENVVWDEHDVVNTTSGMGLTLTHGDKKNFLVLLEDMAGNLECYPQCGGRVAVPTGVKDPSAVLLAARDNKADSMMDIPTGPVPPWKNLVVDIFNPRIVFTNNPLLIGDRSESLEGTHRVGVTTPVELRYEVHKQNHEVAPWSVVRLDSLEDESFAAETPAVLVQDLQEPHRFHAKWSDWASLVDTEPAWPEGQILLSITAGDESGNAGERSFQGTILLDHTPPTVVDAWIEYPPGRLHAEEGDEVRLVVKATDPPVADQVVPARDLKVTLEESDVVDPTGEGTCFRVFCFSTLDEHFFTRFTVAAPEDDETVGNGSRLLPVPFIVNDPSGNARPSQVNLTIGAPGIGITDEPIMIDVGKATIQVTTQKTASVYLVHGNEPDRLSLETPISEAGTEHTFTIEGLTPGQDYHYHAIAVDPLSKAEEQGTLKTFRVPFGVSVDLEKPSNNDHVSGLAQVLVRASVEGAPEAEPRIQLRLIGDSVHGGSQLVWDAPTRSKIVQMDLITDALPDGEYTVEATAMFGEETAVSKIPLLIFDNTPPSVRVIEPVPGSQINRTPDRIVIEATDELSGVNPENARFRLDGMDITSKVNYSMEHEGSKHYFTLTDLPDFSRGVVSFTTFIEDLAGNIGASFDQFTLTFLTPGHFDPRISYPAGQEAVKPGQTIRVIMEAPGASSVVLDTSSIHGPTKLHMVSRESRFVADIPVPNVVEPGSHLIEFSIRDGSGNSAHANITVEVQDEPVEILDVHLRPSSMETGIVEVSTSGPARLLISITDKQDGSTGSVTHIMGTESEDLGMVYNASLTGLILGRSYEIRAQITDAIGNEDQSIIQWQFVPVVVEPPLIRGVDARLTSDQSIHLTWSIDYTLPEGIDEIPKGAVEYLIYRSKGKDYKLITLATGFDFLDRTVGPGQTYSYFIVPKNIVGNVSTASETVQIEVPKMDSDVTLNVTPTKGIAWTTEFEFNAVFGPETEPPMGVWLVLPEDRFRMEPAQLDQDCAQGCTFKQNVRLPALTMSTPELDWYVEVLRGSGELKRVPEIGYLVGPEVISGPPGEGNPEFTLTEEYTTPASPIGLLVLILFMGYRLISRRRQT